MCYILQRKEKKAMRPLLLRLEKVMSVFADVGRKNELEEGKDLPDNAALLLSGDTTDEEEKEADEAKSVRFRRVVALDSSEAADVKVK